GAEPQAPASTSANKAYIDGDLWRKAYRLRSHFATRCSLARSPCTHKGTARYSPPPKPPDKRNTPTHLVWTHRVLACSYTPGHLRPLRTCDQRPSLCDMGSSSHRSITSASRNGLGRRTSLHWRRTSPNTQQAIQS